MTRLTVEERQKLGERRREMRKNGAEERLIEASRGKWRLEWWKGKKKLADQGL
jgi:hypothetical protein